MRSTQGEGFSLDTGGSAWQAYKQYRNTPNVVGISKPEAQAYYAFMSNKIKTDPSYVVNFSDPNSRATKELDAYMKSKGFNPRVDSSAQPGKDGRVSVNP
jgi:hypothetical protein